MSNPTSFNSKSPIRERKRAPIACMNCRIRKLKCRSLDLVENSPCERCVKERLFCEYRPVDQGTASNSHASSNYPIQDNTVNLYPVPSPYPTNQPHWFQPNVPTSTSGGYTSNYPYYPSSQAPLPHANPPFYPTPQPQQIFPHSSYHAPQHTYPALPPAYPTSQYNYQPSPQFSGQPPNQLMSYYAPAPAPTPAPYRDDHRAYPFDNYGNQIDDNSKSGKE